MEKGTATGNPEYVKKAEEYYKKAIEVSPYSPAYENLASLYINEQDFITAERFLLNALRKMPNNNSLWLSFSKVEYALGKQTEAIAAAERSYLLLPSDQTYQWYIYVTQHVYKPDN